MRFPQISHNTLCNPYTFFSADVAAEREVEGGLLLADMGQGVPFRAGSFDGAISISALQWLGNADKTSHNPKRRLKVFFRTLFAALVSAQFPSSFLFLIPCCFSSCFFSLPRPFSSSFAFVYFSQPPLLSTGSWCTGCAAAVSSRLKSAGDDFRPGSSGRFHRWPRCGLAEQQQEEKVSATMNISTGYNVKQSEMKRYVMFVFL